LEDVWDNPEELENAAVDVATLGRPNVVVEVEK